MTTKRLIGWLFFLSALAAALVMPTHDLYAELAVCDKGVCTMKESDYRTLQKFHARAVEIYQSNDAVTSKMANDIEGLQGALARCQSQQKRPL